MGIGTKSVGITFGSLHMRQIIAPAIDAFLTDLRRRGQPAARAGGREGTAVCRRHLPGRLLVPATSGGDQGRGVGERHEHPLRRHLPHRRTRGALPVVHPTWRLP